ncbi:AI-2E family transporter [Pleomorphovibrio marinus]|uniref:AI-2E family transporter n=1 Tax=Pleomorphovibrio marinus TaxID=2164132 RepID=UPI000E0B0445|nr:AI-2E family transporter [Pleomorphovibrio marinus]
MKIRARYGILEKITFVLLFLILLILGLIESREFVVPLFLGILLSYLLYPIGRFLEAHKVPRIIANLVAIIIAAGVIVLAVNFLSKQFGVFIEDLPEIQEQASKNMQSMREQVSSAIGISTEQFTDWEEEFTENLFEASSQVKTLFSATTSTLVNIGLMPVFIFCFLYYRNKFHDFIIMMTPNGNKEKAVHILAEINLVTRKYMTGVVIVVTILSIVHSVTFTIIGLDYPVFFGVTAAFFNFIPYFGTLIGAILPLSYAFLGMEGSSYVVAVLIYFIVIQFIENNILTPNITGGYVNLNPFITIISLIFGSMVWGVAGMLLIIPIIAMLKICCENISSLKPIGFLLSDRGTEKYSFTWEKLKNIFSKG